MLKEESRGERFSVAKHLRKGNLPRFGTHVDGLTEDVPLPAQFRMPVHPSQITIDERKGNSAKRRLCGPKNFWLGLPDRHIRSRPQPRGLVAGLTLALCFKLKGQLGVLLDYVIKERPSRCSVPFEFIHTLFSFWCGLVGHAGPFRLGMLDIFHHDWTTMVLLIRPRTWCL